MKLKYLLAAIAVAAVSQTAAAAPGQFGAYSSVGQGYDGLKDVVGANQGDIAIELQKLQGLKGDELDRALIQVQFKVNQYNEMIRKMGDIGKGMNDTLKSICQKV